MADENKDLIAAITKLTSTVTQQNKEMGEIHQGFSGGFSILGVIAGYIKELTSFGPAMDTLGAKFSTSVEGNIAESHKLAKAFADNGVPASVWDAVSFNLHTNSLALDANNEGLRNLFGVTMATGENYTALAKALGSVTIGTKNQSKSINELAASLEDTARRSNMSRESLIAAMSKLSSNTLNLMATTANGSVALQGAMGVLKGRIGDDRLFGDLSTLINRMLTPEGLVGAQAMGMDMGSLIDGNLTQTEVLNNLLAMLDRMSEMQTSTGIAAVFQLQALKGTIGDISVATSVGNKLAENTLDEQKIANKNFETTWAMLMKELVRPLVTEFGGFFFKMKEALNGSFGIIMKKLLFGIGKVVLAGATAVVSAIQWLAEQILPSNNGMISMMDEGMKEAEAQFNKLKSAAEKIEENTKTTAQIQKDRRMEENNKKLSDAIRTQAKFSVHQSKAFPVLMKKLIALTQEGNKISKGQGGPVNVMIGDTGGGHGSSLFPAVSPAK